MIYLLLVIAFLFYILVQLNIERLLAILILIFVFYYAYTNMEMQRQLQEKSSNNVKTNITNDISDRKELLTDNYYIKKGTKDIRFLLKNNVLISVIKNINFVKKYNKSKYSNIIILMNKLMKVYVYILADRYDINTYLPVFVDLKTDILEIFYSLVFIIPEHIDDAYNVNPHNEIQISINNFLKETSRMLNIIKNYSKTGKQEVFIKIEKYRPYEKNKELYLP